MEPITLITTALALATPYLIKSGEKIAEGIGEEIWNLIKKPFIKNDETPFSIDITQKEEKDKLINLLSEEIERTDFMEILKSKLIFNIIVEIFKCNESEGRQ